MVNHSLSIKTSNAEAKTRALAKKVYKTAKQPNIDFRKVAASYSKGPNANKGGDLGLLKKDKLPQIFLEQIATLNIGDITQPFRSNAGYHILKLANRTGAEPVIVEQSLVKHILVKPTELFTLKEAKDKINDIYQRILKGENFETLAKKNTDDVGSKLSGGELGWSNPGKFVPEFENTMNSTPIGEVSKPFRSQFGWHIIKIDDRRTQDIFEEVKRSQVIKILRNQRFQDELQIWLQELRDDAYVEILI